MVGLVRQVTNFKSVCIGATYPLTLPGVCLHPYQGSERQTKPAEVKSIQYCKLRMLHNVSGPFDHENVQSASKCLLSKIVQTDFADVHTIHCNATLLNTSRTQRKRCAVCTDCTKNASNCKVVLSLHLFQCGCSKGGAV